MCTTDTTGIHRKSYITYVMWMLYTVIRNKCRKNTEKYIFFVGFSKDG